MQQIRQVRLRGGVMRWRPGSAGCFLSEKRAHGQKWRCWPEAGANRHSRAGRMKKVKVRYVEQDIASAGGKDPPMNAARLFPLTFFRRSARKGRMSWGMRRWSGWDQGWPLSSKRPEAEFQRFDAPNMQYFGSFMQWFGPNMQHFAPFMQWFGPNMQHFAPFMQLIGPNMQHFGSFMQLNGPNMQYFASFMQWFGPNMQHFAPFMQLNGPNMQLICPAQRRFGAFRHEVGLIRLTIAVAKLWLGRTGLFPAAPERSTHASQHTCRTFLGLTAPFL